VGRAAALALAILSAGCAPEPARPYAGSEACRSCHAAEHRAWAGSLHAAAARETRPAFVQASFDGSAVAASSVAATPQRTAGGYGFEVAGVMHSATLTLGRAQVEQFLVPFAGGRPAEGRVPAVRGLRPRMGDYVDYTPVEAEVAADVDARFQQIWSALNATLVAGDKEGALQFLNVHARPRFEPVWTAILTDPNNMSELVAGFLGFQPLSVGQDIAVYALRTTENGEARVYLVTFLRGEDGVWRLAEM
jgi:hypothetical protein